MMNEKEKERVETTLGVAIKIAKSFCTENSRVCLSDAIQEAYLELCYAAMKYDENSTASFTSFAYTCVMNRMRDVYRSEKRTPYMISMETGGRSTDGSVSRLEIGCVNPETCLIESISNVEFIGAMNRAAGAYKGKAKTGYSLIMNKAMSEEKYLAAKSKMTKNEYDVCIRAAKAKLCENNFIKDIFINAA